MIAFILDRFNLLKKYTGSSLRDVVSSLLKPQQEYYISKLAPPVQQRFRDLIKAIEATGYSVILTSSTRPFSYGSIDGSHPWGIGVDMNLQKGTSLWRSTTKGGTKQSWEATGVPQIIRSLGFRWGGDFVGGSFPVDLVHVDLKNVYDTNHLKQLAIAKYGSNLTSMDISGVEFVSWTRNRLTT